jgi:hypothetical protein
MKLSISSKYFAGSYTDKGQWFCSTIFCHFSPKKVGKKLENFVLLIFWKISPIFLYHKIEKKKKKTQLGYILRDFDLMW